MVDSGMTGNDYHPADPLCGAAGECPALCSRGSCVQPLVQLTQGLRPPLTKTTETKKRGKQMRRRRSRVALGTWVKLISTWRIGALSSGSRRNQMNAAHGSVSNELHRRVAKPSHCSKTIANNRVTAHATKNQVAINPHSTYALTPFSSCHLPIRYAVYYSTQRDSMVANPTT